MRCRAEFAYAQPPRPRAQGTIGATAVVVNRPGCPEGNPQPAVARPSLNDCALGRMLPTAGTPARRRQRGAAVARSGSPGLSSARAWLLPAVITILLAAGVLLSAFAQLRPSDAHAQDEPAAEVAPLCERIDELARDAQLRLAVDLGITLIDLQTGESCEVRPTRIFRSASLYKLVVLAEAYRQREELGFDFEQTIELLPRHSLDDPAVVGDAGHQLRLDGGDAGQGGSKQNALCGGCRFLPSAGREVQDQRHRSG